MKRWFLILLAALLLVPTTARADISFLLHESIGAAGEFTGSGHAAIYLSNICTEDGFSLRLCREDESGVVISSYRNFGNGSTYEWMAVPLVPFLYGVDDQSEIPIYANSKIRNFLKEKYRHKHLNAIIPAAPDGTMPAGLWQMMLTTVFNRDIYGFTVKTTADQDAQFLRESNSKPNNGTFHTLTSNCADFAGRIINRYFPGAARRDWINDAGITTPKAIARSFFNYAKDRPEMGLSISRFPQIPGPIVRSSDNRNLTEMAYTSKKYLIPSILFKPELIAIFSATYLLTGRFNVHKTYEKYANAEIARLERETRTASTMGIDVFCGKSWQRRYRSKTKTRG
ncbi:MAG: hypothetical protein IPK98_10830 [Chloracidobacterium sp.]|nr:hypothetical protein [Chloracidobacterium sp.]